MPDIGLNYRVTDIQCALGLSQMKKLARFVARRQALADRYDRQVADLAPLVPPIARSAAAEPAWHLYPLMIDFAAAGRSRAAVMDPLHAADIRSRGAYMPVISQHYLPPRLVYLTRQVAATRTARAP